jgi:hypothetical protein
MARLFWTFSAFEMSLFLNRLSLLHVTNWKLMKYNVDQVHTQWNINTKNCNRPAEFAQQLCKIFTVNTVSADEVECSCHFPASGRNLMTHCQVLKDFPDISQVSFHKNIKINLIILLTGAVSHLNRLNCLNFINLFITCFSLTLCLGIHFVDFVFQITLQIKVTGDRIR